MALNSTNDTHHDFDLNFPFVECINGGECNSDVSGFNANQENSQESNIVINENQTETATEALPIDRPSRQLGNNKKKSIVQHLISISRDGILPKGSIKAQSIKWNVSRWTIWRLWSSAKKSLALGTRINVKCKKKGRVGRKPKVFDMELLRAIAIEKLTTVRAVASACGIGHSTVYRLMKLGIIRSHTNSIKPKLSPEQKHKRMHFILSHIIPPTLHMLPRFSLMHNLIHIDEKWFEMSKETQRFYLFHSDFQDEIEPYRCVQNKNFIGKVMFLAAIARPRKAANGEVLWDGNIGIFPFTEDHVAVRNSGNRPAGTIELRAVTRVTRDVIRKKNSEEVLPAIRAKWPANGVKDIWIQQDNARPHILCNDPEFNEAATKDGFNIRLVCQPASSPDMNILDLGFFSAIQSIQFKTFPKDVKELVKAVHDAYETYNPTFLNYTWLQLQLSMLEVLKVKDGNNYKNPHIGKQRLDRLDLLPAQIEVPTELIEGTKQILEDGIIDLNIPLQ